MELREQVQPGTSSRDDGALCPQKEGGRRGEEEEGRREEGGGTSVFTLVKVLPSVQLRGRTRTSTARAAPVLPAADYSKEHSSGARERSSLAD